jgi:predicted metal-dependent hydrolase
VTEDQAPLVKVERPRDEFGRPLPAGSENRLHLENFDVLPLAEVEALALRHFNAGNYFGAHEAWETVWRQERGAEDEEFFKGLSQIGAGYTHVLRGNAHGARALLERGLDRIEPYGPRRRGVDVEALLRAGRAHQAAFAQAEQAHTPLPALEPPRA